MTPFEAPVAIVPEESTVWPWQAEPHHLWSLLDMIRIGVPSLIAAIGNLEKAEGAIVNYALVGDTQTMTAESVTAELVQRLSELEVAIANLPLSFSYRAQVARAKGNVLIGSDGHNMGTMARVQEVKHNLAYELASHAFFCVPEQRRNWYQDEDRALFGDEVDNSFQDSTPEISEAGRCFALARWTACVFHLMRALELALHKWAKQLGVDQFDALELENWKTILDAARKKIEALEQQKKSPAKDADLQYYGETRAHFLAVKDAWRNHVAHARERYDEGRAISIMNHVRDFMRLLAAKP